MFDFSKDYGESSFDLIPEGQYPVHADKIDWKISKAGQEYLEIQFSIFGSMYANRKIFHRLNLFHESEQVRNFAMADLKRFFLASGKDTSKLVLTKDSLGAAVMQCTCQAQVKIEISKDPQYPDKNVIKGWKPISKVSPPVYDTITTDTIPF
jgi:hypothetical protein